ncbi:amino-acid N-acetyltransferase [Sansalvadorimonas sp. 2012CJ34-2]|uniref:Amino-acid acetyltransferase n=1 Tax=Parendozoicomonas callyspongiae TaxID=2942213 RepID=A0ABT0PD20_9GAMM|nr:amino-acid N-acetyltransferase [Sansalvadorimonas sp. 2012CJ34-2]MCL6269230.1 amino-acid N-acetyltransferase [Sansalvadorimonas sp. 2012CJ34-2]
MNISSENYVRFFRQSSPYMHAHRGRTFVIMLPGEALEDTNFPNIIHDIALLSSLGVRLVLVHGARPQISRRLELQKIEASFHNDSRITDKSSLAAVIDANGSMRVRMEAQLSMGLINSPMHGSRIRVVSGNFVTARPLGVVDGVDFQNTGEVRRVDRKAISQQLDDGHLVLLSSLGYSPTGEVFNLSAEDVATRTAIALKAEKLILFGNSIGLQDEDGELIRTMRPREARSRLQSKQHQEFHRLLEAAVTACDSSIVRTHIVSHCIDGALLQELFTRDGFGTLITQDMAAYEQLRPATIEDVGGILKLIQPLEEKGVLVRRSRKQLEREINTFTVLVRDGMIVGCAALCSYPKDGCGELACLVIHPEYRQGKRGDVLLSAIEQQARQQKLKSLFVLTTRTAHWFIERGFAASPLKTLPSEKQEAYNRPRNSKVFKKVL